MSVGQLPREDSVLSAEQAASVLAHLGVFVDPARLVLQRRDEAWLVELPEERLAWFAASEEGGKRLAKERAVLTAIERHCAFEAPRIERCAADGACDVRRKVVGSIEPWQVYERVREDRDLAARIGAELGALLADQHMHVEASELGDVLPRSPAWPLSAPRLLAQLPRVIEDDALVAAAADVLERFDAMVSAGAPQERVLVHCDLGLHNAVFDAETLSLRGVFDYGDAAWADRHYDFRYLLFDFSDETLLQAATAVYVRLTGRPIARERVVLHNAACAVTFLAERVGHDPQARPCGRTLAEDLRWTRFAIERATAVAGG